MTGIDTEAPKKPLGPATAYMIAVGILMADQGSKRYVIEAMQLPAVGSVPLFGPVNFTMVWNRGVSFGLFQAEADIMRWVLAAFSAIVAVLLIWWARKQTRLLPLTAIGLIIGGAIGNLIDRIKYGAVADFVDLSQVFFPWVFNLADSAITIGVILLLVDSVRAEKLSKAS
jgi:signal peptidase II